MFKLIVITLFYFDLHNYSSVIIVFILISLRNLIQNLVNHLLFNKEEQKIVVSLTNQPYQLFLIQYLCIIY